MNNNIENHLLQNIFVCYFHSPAVNKLNNHPEHFCFVFHHWDQQTASIQYLSSVSLVAMETVARLQMLDDQLIQNSESHVDNTTALRKC